MEAELPFRIGRGGGSDDAVEVGREECRVSLRGAQFPARPFRTVRGLRSTADKNTLTFKDDVGIASVLRGADRGLGEK